MREQLNQYHQNRKREGTPLEKLFGDNTKIIEFSQFFEKHQDTLELLTSVRLNDLVSDPKADFNHREIDFYKRGLAEIPSLFAACYAEIQEKKMKESDL